VRFRPLGGADFDGWAALYFSRYDELATNPQLGVHVMEKKPSLGEEAGFFGEVWKHVEAGQQTVTVAEEAGRIVGVYTIYRGTHPEDRHVGTLAVAVLPEWRGRGVGSGLLDHSLRAAEGMFETVLLNVIAVNERALRLYRKFGFGECGRTPRTFQRNGVYYDTVSMSKSMSLPGTNVSDSP
jgi:ribosomal protein S18 acetylase RimI-like enzyme